MSDATYPVFPIFAIIGFFIVLIPLPWHLQAWNSGTCLYMGWVAIACLNQFVNSIVWHANVIDHAPVWCDISTRIILGSAVGIPAASLCINRRLYKIASVQTVSISRKDKQRAIVVDLLIGLGLPFIQMALQYIVQGHRYDIFEDIGCFPVTYNTPPAYPLVMLWPILIGMVSACYCLSTLRAFLKRRAQFSELLSSHSSLTMNRYFRLMALASADLICTVPYSSYGVYLNLASSSMNPWRGWADVHFNFSRVGLVPAVVWHLNHPLSISLELSRWFLPICAIIFFAFFGFADEARKNYRGLYDTCARHVPFFVSSSRPVKNPRLNKNAPSYGVAGTLPLYVSRPPKTEDGSFNSFASLGEAKAN